MLDLWRSIPVLLRVLLALGVMAFGVWSMWPVIMIESGHRDMPRTMTFRETRFAIITGMLIVSAGLIMLAGSGRSSSERAGYRSI